MLGKNLMEGAWFWKAPIICHSHSHTPLHSAQGGGRAENKSTTNPQLSIYCKPMTENKILGNKTTPLTPTPFTHTLHIAQSGGWGQGWEQADSKTTAVNIENI